MKIKDKIRNKLRTWFFETELKDLQKSTIQMQMARNQYSDAYRLVNDCHQLINSMMDVGNYPEIDITVDASCCAGVTPDTHKAALATMKMCQIEVIGE